MKKILFLAFLMQFLNAQEFTTKYNGELVNHKVTQKEDKYFVNDKKYFKAKGTLIVVYTSKERRLDLEKKYNLTNHQDSFGDHVYEHESADVLSLITSMSNDANIKSVYPNWHKIYLRKNNGTTNSYK